MRRILFLFAVLSVASCYTKAQQHQDFYKALADSAYTLTKNHVRYDSSYFKIAYPNGDVPPNVGVCTDVVIRAYRKMGIDLQKEVHEDMTKNFKLYPNNWGLKGTDRNIDHRRVPNLMTFFSRFGVIKNKSLQADDYQAGDIICWRLPNGMTHIGIASNRRSKDGERPLIIHNIGSGQVLDDCLFFFTIIGHYSYKK